jgi:hypothetical protein
MQAAPLGFALFLLQLAVGGIVVTAALDWDGEVSPGFLFLNSAFLVAFGAAGLWLRSVLPAELLLPYPVDAALVRSEPLWWGLFLALSVAFTVLLRLDRRTPRFAPRFATARVMGALAAVAGTAVLAAVAVLYLPPGGSLPLLLASLMAGALALGTVWSGMMLGHWYLVTPRLAPRPLLRLTAALAAVLAVQGLLIAGQAVAGLAASVLGAPLSLLFALRVGVGVLFPLALCYLVWRTARVRSMMSATGLLYIALGTVLAGQIIASALFFLAGAPI